MKEDIVRITFRIPRHLYEDIVKKAEENRRSINSEMIVALEEFIKNDNKK